jgi:two-component system cell cycle sensor histidine kinase/response regulator CckA
VEGAEHRRVLIVEDDEAVRGFLARALETFDCEPVGVANGEEALRLITEQGGVAAVLVDGILPGMHGFRLAERVLEEPEGRRTALCFVTGAIRDPAPIVAGVGALGKPVRLAELRTTLEDMFRWRDSGGSPLKDRRAVLERVEQSFLVGP